jgi:hypothetical protein
MFGSSNDDGTVFGHGVGHPQGPEEKGIERRSLETRLNMKDFRHLLAGI